MQEEIFSSSFASVGYLSSINFPADKKVYIVGVVGIELELQQAGIQRLGGPGDGDKKIDLAPEKYMEHDHDVGAVVVGFDRCELLQTSAQLIESVCRAWNSLRRAQLKDRNSLRRAQLKDRNLPCLHVTEGPGKHC